MSVIALGPTGEFPDGQIQPEDKGEVAVAIGSIDGLVRIEFGTKVTWLAMSPHAARELAEALNHFAEQAENDI